MVSRALIVAVLGLAALGILEAQNGSNQGTPQRGQPAQGTQPAQNPTADPYANNANAGATTFPLAATAGADSKASTTAPSGAVNQGAFAPGTW